MRFRNYIHQRRQLRQFQKYSKSNRPEEQKRQSELDANRKSQVGTGERSEKIRTYNFPQSRVTDHRINLSSYNISGILDGNIDEFIEELSLQEETERLAMAGMGS